MMVGGVSLVLGYELTAQQWFGFMLITLGCMLVPLTHFNQMRPASYLNVGLLGRWWQRWVPQATR